MVDENLAKRLSGVTTYRISKFPIFKGERCFGSRKSEKIAKSKK
jgi:hypothetical protein